jgi:hypothetical protein
MENSNFFVPAQDFFPTASKVGKTILVHAKEDSDERIPCEVDISNARELLNTSLDTNGFVLCNNESKVNNFFDPQEICNVYYSEIVELLKKQTGAKRVFIFNHTFRSGDESERITLKNMRQAALPPAKMVHNDYTDWSGPQELKIRLSEETKERFAIIHTWQPIKPVYSDPLAIVDAKSVQKNDLIVKTIDAGDRINQTYHMKHSSSHKWYYYPDMQPNEVLFFKGYDSEKDGRTRFTPHGSFSMGNDTPARQSIELRTFVFF